MPTPPTAPNLYDLANLSHHLIDVRGDIGDLAQLCQVIETYEPTIIFHLAAQPIVHIGYRDPKMTFDVNAGGTINVLEALRTTNCVKRS